jgi:hypothetical protein
VTRSVTLPRPRCLRLRPRFRPPGSGGSPWLEVGEGAVFTAASEINRIMSVGINLQWSRLFWWGRRERQQIDHK